MLLEKFKHARFATLGRLKRVLLERFKSACYIGERNLQARAAIRKGRVLERFSSMVLRQYCDHERNTTREV